MSKIPSYKTLLIGDPDVGKTHMDIRLLHNTFEKPNLRGGHPYCRVQLFDLQGKQLKLKIWDVPQGRYCTMSTNHYSEAVGVWLVYDITRRESFENAAQWLNEARDYSYFLPEMPIILVGNKADLENEREISYEEGRRFAEENGLVFFESSNKTGENVKRVFWKMAELINEKAESGAFEKKEIPWIKALRNRQNSKKGSCAC